MTEPFNHLKLLKSGVFMGEGSSCIEHQQQGSCFNSLKAEHDPPWMRKKQKYTLLNLGKQVGDPTTVHNSHLGKTK